VMAVDTGRLPLLSRWCGLALVAAGVLMVVATLLHPSRETATRSSPASRGWLRRMWFTRWLGCWCCSAFPDSTRRNPGAMGRLGLASFLTAFTGAYLIAMTGNFGFLAPVLAKQSPAVFDSISQYPPVVIINGLAAILFMIGYVLFGVAMIRTVTLRHWSGVLAAVALRTTWRVSR
jgi:hypothetical protein